MRESKVGFDMIPLSADMRFKHAVDRVVATAALLVLVGPLLVISLLVSTTSTGPPLFVQRRIGHRGRAFHMLKVRSMVTDAESRISEVRHLHLRREDGPQLLFKARADPRVTALGYLLRRWSIDEVPQLVNVVRGEMSLVGPRPALPAEVRAYAPGMLRRLSVRPGVTGLWQVSGRSELSAAESAGLDLWYVNNWSLVVDLRILFRTCAAVLRRTGAY